MLQRSIATTGNTTPENPDSQDKESVDKEEEVQASGDKESHVKDSGDTEVSSTKGNYMIHCFATYFVVSNYHLF